MRSITTFYLALLLSYSLIGQDSSRFVHRGLIRAGATFTTGIFLKGGLTASYLSGNAEYYFHENASIRGDGYYFLNYVGDEKPLELNHSVAAGVSWHFPTKGNADPYVYFQPGLSVSRSYEILDSYPVTIGTSNTSTGPQICLGAGVNYYFQKIFHLFAEARYTHGKHFSNYAARSLTDVKLSFGLGFNIR